jgi:hypothetical protein
MSTLSSLQIRPSCEFVLLLLGNIAGTAKMLLGVLVVDKKLAILSVAVGLVARNRDDVEDTGCLVEDCVHFFQRSVGCLWVEEIYNGEDEGVANYIG